MSIETALPFALALTLSAAAPPPPSTGTPSPSADAVASEIVADLNVPGCPRLGALYNEAMAKLVPEAKRAEFCANARAASGQLLRAERVGSDGTWALYVVHAEHGRWSMKLALNDKGRISGFSLNADAPPLATVKQPLRWPVEGETFVVHGGASADVNAHVTNVRQRRALDLCAADASGRTRKETGARAANADYYVYGRPVLASAAGVVDVVIDGVPDNAPGDMNRDVVPGNLVVIDHGNGEHAHYAHLQPGSVRVKRGQAVRAGDVLGLVGNSGNSREPHLHFHVQDSKRIDAGHGIDVVFDGVVVDGQARDGHQPRRGERITRR